MKNLLWLVLSVGLVFGGAGCTTMGGGDGAARLAVQYAVYKYTQGEAEKAARVQAVVDDTIALIDGDLSATIPVLKQAVLSQINMESLDAADQFLVRSLIDQVAMELAGRVGDGQLDGDRLLKIRDVLGWVRDAAFTTASGVGIDGR